MTTEGSLHELENSVINIIHNQKPICDLTEFSISFTQILKVALVRQSLFHTLTSTKVKVAGNLFALKACGDLYEDIKQALFK